MFCITRGVLRPFGLTQVIQTAGMKHFQPPPNFDHVILPEKRKLQFLDKVPQYPSGLRPPKMAKRLELIRGPESVHTEYIHKQYGIVATCGGRLHSGHMEMIRMTINKKMDTSCMFAIWRVDPPWQPLTKKGQGKRMGGGKGAIDRYVTPIKAGRVIMELGGKCEFQQAYPFLKEVAEKLPFRAKPMSYDEMVAEKLKEEELNSLNTNPYTPEYVIRNNMGGCHKWISIYDKQWFFKYV
nr:EOG090X0DE4 [Polyphemus pediculus]